MAREKHEDRTRDGRLSGIISFTGVALFVMELGAGLDYVQARLANLLPGYMGVAPAVGVAAWKVAEAAFWNYAQLERTFRIVPFVALPFLLVGWALCVRYQMVIHERNSVESEQS